MEREGMATYEMFQKKYTRWIQRTRRTNNGPSLTEVEKGKGAEPLEIGGWGWGGGGGEVARGGDGVGPQRRT